MGERIVKNISYSFGIIDYLHFGHVQALLEAKRASDLHVFGLVSEHAAKLWTGAMISTYEERKRVLEQVSCIDEIMCQENFDPTENLQKLHKRYPHAKITLYHGSDWKVLPAEDYLRSIGGSVVFTPYYEKLSPGRILQTLQGEDGASAHPQSNLISTKANTLKALKPLLRKSSIEDLLIVRYGEFQKDRERVLRDVQNKFGGKKIVVRSSSSNEDCFESSNAGHFESVLNVDSSDKNEVGQAIFQVFDSYNMEEDSHENDNEQVLVQFQTNDVVRSGVVFTRDINQNRPYYIINYDGNGSTDAVTSGAGGETVWLARNTPTEEVSSPWRGLIAAVRELEEILNGMVLDIEFAIDSENRITIFQVRPLAAIYKFKREFDDEKFFALQCEAKNAYNFVSDDVKSDTLQLSDMAFWNPAEIIGSNPHNLDYSLYREIITKRVWNEGIVPVGYKKVPKELMCRIGNKPYIVLEHAFRSLVPADLSEELTDKLVRYYIGQLKKDLSAHDKIEFEITLSCFDFGTDEKLEEMHRSGNFSDAEIAEIRNSLRSITQRAISEYKDVLEKDTECLRELEFARCNIERKLEYQKTDPFALLRYFQELILSINKNGTPMFSRQARYAFISKAICRTMVDAGYYDQDEMECLLNSVHTVASDFEADYKAFMQGALSSGEFNRRYGHLRSGTYDIRALRYDQIDYRGQVTPTTSAQEREKPAFMPNLERFGTAQKALGIDGEPEHLTWFIKTSLEQREYFKFEFTKALSLAMEILVMAGEAIDIPRRDLSHLEFADILAAEYYHSPRALEGFWKTLIAHRRALYKENEKLVLPEVILQARDITETHFLMSRPNFITTKAVEADAVLLTAENSSADLQGKIVVLEKADPGYDWIFTQGISGLVTKYGGVASHMAIRCAEFNLPAAIGCGEKIYNEMRGATHIRINCKKGEIRRI